MEIVTSWMEEGIEKGLKKGREEGRREGASHAMLRMLARRFGPVAPELAARVTALPLDALDRLAEVLLDFKTVSDLDRWLTDQRS